MDSNQLTYTSQHKWIQDSFGVTFERQLPVSGPTERCTAECNRMECSRHVVSRWVKSYLVLKINERNHGWHILQAATRGRLLSFDFTCYRDCYSLTSLFGAVMSMAECVASRNCIASKMNISRQTWRRVFVLTMFRFSGCTTTCCHCVSVMADSWSLSDSHLWGSTSDCRMEVLLVQSWPEFFIWIQHMSTDISIWDEWYAQSWEVQL